MKNPLTGWFAALAISLFSLTGPAQAQLAAGHDYIELQPPQVVDDPTKVEVVEYFSYACPHCSELSPDLNDWVAKLPPDVVFRRIPVSFNSPFYQLMAKFYYTLEALGEVQRLDSAVFSAIHTKGLRLVSESSIREWATAQGIDAKRFSDAFNSFGVASKVKRADQLARSSKIDAVPSLVVDGRYRVIGENVSSHQGLLALTDKVIDKARQDHKKGKK